MVTTHTVPIIVAALTSHAILTECFVPRTAVPASQWMKKSTIRMDSDYPQSSFGVEHKFPNGRSFLHEMTAPRHETHSQEEVIFRNLRIETPVSAVENTNGMPWRTSIAESESSSPPLLYMPFWEWQMSFMKENLTNLRVLPCTAERSSSYSDSTQDLSYTENTEKKARMVNLCFASDEYRRIRMTYYDAGEGCQVFNSLWYPHESSNLPILGIDLLAFNNKKYLGIVDFQPLHEDESDHQVTFEKSILKPIRDKFPSLHGKMSAKFYDETQFFSRQMLFARFEDQSLIQKDLLPAFQEYVSAHVDLIKSIPRTYERKSMELVEERQAAYDTYSAVRDPATGLFASMFGKEWADEFVYGFLFSNSEKGEGPPPPMMGGPPQSQHQGEKAKDKAVEREENTAVNRRRT